MTRVCSVGVTLILEGPIIPKPLEKKPPCQYKTTTPFRKCGLFYRLHLLYSSFYSETADGFTSRGKQKKRPDQRWMGRSIYIFYSTYHAAFLNQYRMVHPGRVSHCIAIPSSRSYLKMNTRHGKRSSSGQAGTRTPAGLIFCLFAWSICYFFIFFYFFLSG